MIKNITLYISTHIISIVENLLVTAMIIIVAYVSQLLTKRFVKQSLNQITVTHRIETIQNVLNSAIATGVWGIAAVMILSSWGLNITPIITGAGVVGLAVGFGSQTLVRDVVTGFFILLENQYNVGDYVEVMGVKGEVIDINLRTTIIKAEDKSIHIIPNSQITKVAKNITLNTPSESDKPASDDLSA